MLVFYLLIFYLQSTIGQHFTPTLSAEYDMLIFTEVWPPTSCYEWEEKSPLHKCNLPPNEEWSIHGLWPTKNGTMGPFFCNHTLPFNLSALSPLRPNLDVKWIDVHKGSKPQIFWKHEWEKHGVCSIDLENLNNEYKYFKKALDLLEEYDMKNVLAKASIILNQSYRLQDYLEGIKKILGKNAYVECIKSRKRNETYISDIRICFDKQLNLIDCNGIPHFPGNCNPNEKITYPGSVPDLFNKMFAIEII